MTKNDVLKSLECPAPRALPDWLVASARRLERLDRFYWQCIRASCAMLVTGLAVVAISSVRQAFQGQFNTSMLMFVIIVPSGGKLVWIFVQVANARLRKTFEDRLRNCPVHLGTVLKCSVEPNPRTPDFALITIKISVPDLKLDEPLEFLNGSYTLRTARRGASRLQPGSQVHVLADPGSEDWYCVLEGSELTPDLTLLEDASGKPLAASPTRNAVEGLGPLPLLLSIPAGLVLVEPVSFLPWGPIAIALGAIPGALLGWFETKPPSEMDALPLSSADRRNVMKSWAFLSSAATLSCVVWANAGLDRTAPMTFQARVSEVASTGDGGRRVYLRLREPSGPLGASMNAGALPGASRGDDVTVTVGHGYLGIPWIKQYSVNNGTPTASPENP